jgi:hypothetical protein
MTTQYTPPSDTWGAPAPEHHRQPWSTKRIVVSVVAAVVIIAGGTTAVVAATNGSSTTGSGPGGGVPFGGGGGAGFGGGAATGLTNALHGDFVVSSGTGYATERLQTGTVTAVSATDITLKSKDGYTQTYVVGSGTTVDQGSDSISKVANGNTVTVVAKVDGRTATATTIEDTTIDTRARGGNTGQGGGPGGFGGPPGN